MADKKDKLEIEVGPEGGKLSVAGEGAGRLSKALADLISPITEGAGFFGDQIRVYRQKAAINAMQEVLKIAEEQDVDLKLVPPKIFIPWLEKTSLEEPESPLIKWWVSLLVSAADPKFETRPYFSDLVSKITADEASLLERLWKEGRHVDEKELPGGPLPKLAIFLRSDFEKYGGTSVGRGATG